MRHLPSFFSKLIAITLIVMCGNNTTAQQDKGQDLYADSAYSGIVDRNLMLDDSLARMNDRYRLLEVQTKKLLAEVAAYRISLNLLEAQDEDEVEPETEKRIIPENERVIGTTGYNFVDLKNSPVPSGFYLVTDVHYSRSMAMESLKQTKTLGYANAYLILNKTNRFYYVIMLYSTNDQEVFKARREYVKKSTVKTWILEYFSVD